jgi:hypothetical protein
VTAVKTSPKPGNPFQPTPLDAARAIHDKAILIMDAKWGTDVVQTLVSPTTAAKFARWCCRRDEAIEQGDEATAVTAMENVVRGLKAMDQEATEAGHKPLDPDRSWATRDANGQPWVLVQTDDDARAAARSDRFKGYTIISLREVLAVLNDRSLEAVLKAKQLWPEATVTAVTPPKPPVDWLQGDQIPF